MHSHPIWHERYLGQTCRMVQRYSAVSNLLAMAVRANLYFTPDLTAVESHFRSYLRGRQAVHTLFLLIMAFSLLIYHVPGSL
mmetsp:Transcript_151313/g.263751  ORF Transcript_151313/g.263751 Transcript_151313/m.263751 type:complete len:82 (-) Transcript_151313:265-510(-)